MSDNININGSQLDGEPEKTRKEKKGKKPKKEKKQKIQKLKNELLLRRGGFSLLITVLFLAAVIVFNLLISALSDRFSLEYDLSADKQSTVTKENVDYIKNVSSPITVTVCAAEDNYVSNISYLASQMYSLSGDYQDYYKQTLLFVNKYHDYNKLIDVQYVDMYNDSKFSEISYKYPNESISYGDIIVSANVDNNGTATERHKVLSFGNIYNLTEDSNSSYYQMYGMGSSYTISGNNIESALSGAIEYVLGVDKNAVLLTGHSSSTAESYYTAYKELLESNNFNVEAVDAAAINSMPEKCDVVVIIQPDTDFSASELELLDNFLYNDGNLRRTLIYVGGASSKALPNLNEFLNDWGIKVSEGKLFETSGDYSLSGDPTTVLMRSTYGSLVSSENAPITVGTATDSDTEAQAFISTPDSVVAAPVGAGSDWNDYSNADKGTYALSAVSIKKGYDSDNNEVNSAVFAFSSADFISPKQESSLNTQYSLYAAEAFSDSGVAEVSFTPKTITGETVTPNESTSRALNIVFVILLPISMIVIAIFIYIRRKNAK